MKRKLVVDDGTRERELLLVGRIVVGRDPSCEVSHDDSLLSRRHAEFIAAGETVSVRDLGSRNGVFVNGAKAAEQVLETGDIVQIGPLRARYVVEDGVASILPEEIDRDRTEMIRELFTESAPAPAEAPVPDDDEVTRMVPAPRFVGASAVLPAPAPAFVDDEAPTQFMSASDPARPAVAAAPAALQAAAMPETFGSPATFAAAASAPADSGLRSVIMVHLVALATLVLVSSVLSLAVWPRGDAGASVLGVVVPFVVAVVASYLVAASINRRVEEALSAARRHRV